MVVCALMYTVWPVLDNASVSLQAAIEHVEILEVCVSSRGTSSL